MSNQNTNTNGILRGLRITRRDLRVFAASTVLFTTLFAGIVNLDSHYNGGRLESALVTGHQVASLDSGICSAAKFYR